MPWAKSLGSLPVTLRPNAAIRLSTVRFPTPSIEVTSDTVNPWPNKKRIWSLEMTYDGLPGLPCEVVGGWYPSRILARWDSSRVTALECRAPIVSTIPGSISRFTSILCKKSSLNTITPMSDRSVSQSNLATKSFTMWITPARSAIFLVRERGVVTLCSYPIIIGGWIALQLPSWLHKHELRVTKSNVASQSPTLRNSFGLEHNRFWSRRVAFRS